MREFGALPDSHDTPEDHLRQGLVLSLHSFNPVYEGKKRSLEVGVLYAFKEDEDLAIGLRNLLQGRQIFARLNEPYSGFEGIMFSCQRAAQFGNRKLLEYGSEAPKAAVKKERTVQEWFRNVLQKVKKEEESDESLFRNYRHGMIGEELLHSVVPDPTRREWGISGPLRPLMLEVRNDLLEDDTWRGKFVGHIGAFLGAHGFL